jgi:hypothetical protein
MATQPTLRLVIPDTAVVRQPKVSETRVRRFFRRRARRRTLVTGWRDEAFLRATTRGA